MNVQELVHLHALLLELRVDLERKDAVASGTFDAYDTQPVRPSHVHRQKEAHENAIGLLLKGLSQSVRTRPLSDHAAPSEIEHSTP